MLPRPGPAVRESARTFLWILLLGAALLFVLAALSGYLPPMLRSAGLSPG